MQQPVKLAEKTSVLTSSENGDEFAAAFEASSAKTAADSLHLDLSKQRVQRACDQKF